MCATFNRNRNIPSWNEVILGAVLSVILGVIVGAALLVLRPAVAVREVPKGDKLDPKAIYYVKGNRDAGRAKALLEKRAAFLSGQSITLTEGELNTLEGPAPTPAAPKADAKGAAPASEGFLTTGPLNFRLHDGKLQVAAPVTVSVMGASTEVVVQTRGTFVKEANGFVFEPETLYAGSCPLLRLPFVASYVRDKFLGEKSLPDELKAGWAKLANVTIEGNALKLTMP
ncbi:hypothetical protein [Horticoccus sp. 23ND18S-11]|uniref:hypothetical protein n=1 Tax=Horticoccus sp. 23ND18S-11 TaxID=3391832 RepID=UPI0039C9E96F